VPASVSLLDHIKALLDEKDKRDNQRFEAQSQAIKDALQAAKEAVVKAETATEKRFESVNEFRKTLSDQSGTFITRAEFDQIKDATNEKLGVITKRADLLEGRSGGIAQSWAILVGAITIAGVIGAILAKHF